MSTTNLVLKLIKYVICTKFAKVLRNPKHWGPFLGYFIISKNIYGLLKVAQLAQ
jgi:hypothetical protein